MTQSTVRTVAQITAAIDALVKVIEDVDTFVHELRVAAMRPFDGYVVGYDWGMFLAAAKSPMLVGVLNARKFASQTVARDYIITNGKGEVARVMRHADALFITIALQVTLHDNMMDMLADLQVELAAAYEAEAAAQDRADREADDMQMELDYNRALYEDSFSHYDDLRARADIEAATEAERRRKAGRDEPANADGMERTEPHITF